jgi:type IV pilus assembly protein PilY1
VHFGEDGQIRLLLPPGTPQGDTDGDGEENCEAGVCDIGTPLRAPYGDHWFEEGY